MDAELALKPEIPRKLGRAPERVHLTEMDEHRIDWRFESGRARFDDNRGSGVVELALLAGPSHPHVEGVVAGSEREPPHPGAGARDLPQSGDATAGLDDRHKVDAARREAAGPLECRDGPVDRHELRMGLDLWQHDAVDTLSNHRPQVLEAERRVERVDPDIAKGLARCLERSNHLLAGGRFLGDCNGILEVEYHRVRVQRERLFDASGVIARCEQQRSEDEHGDPRFVLVCEAIVDTWSASMRRPYRSAVWSGIPTPMPDNGAGTTPAAEAIASRVARDLPRAPTAYRETSSRRAGRLSMACGAAARLRLPSTTASTGSVSNHPPCFIDSVRPHPCDSPRQPAESRRRYSRRARATRTPATALARSPSRPTLRYAG